MENKDARTYVFEHFKLHSAQRLTTFNFFLVLSALMTTGLATVSGKDSKLPELGVVLGLLLMATSFVFWKLDQRARHLLEVSKDALKQLEQGDDPATRPPWAVFRNEVESSAKRKADWNWMTPWNWHMTYLQCFSAIYGIFFVLGAFGTFLVILRTPELYAAPLAASAKPTLAPSPAAASGGSQPPAKAPQASAPAIAASMPHPPAPSKPGTP